MIQRRKLQLSEAPECCPKCSSATILSQTYSDTVDFRSLELDVEELERFKCESCGLKWDTPAQAKRNQNRVREEYAKVRDRLRTRYGMLTAEKIAETRKQLSLNQREASALFGGGANAFNKYETGEVLQSFAMDRLLRLTGAIGQRAVNFLKNVDSPDVFTLEATTSTKHLVVIMHRSDDVKHRHLYWGAHVRGNDSQVHLQLSGNSPDICSRWLNPSSTASIGKAKHSQPSSYQYVSI